MVFSDLGTPASDGRWDAYTHLRERLVERGVPAEQIRFIHEATNDKAKAELFQQCRGGRVQVLVGSTEKMGVGTNVQARAIALHHVDAPWRPADVTQREGREIRQGNQNAEVHLYRYATEGSVDSYMWGTLARKATFIEQVLTGRLDVREVDNSTEMALQFAEMQAITAGDMRILEVANLRQETQKLARQQRAHRRKIGSIEARKLQLESAANVVGHDLTMLKALAPRIVETRGDKFSGRVKPGSWADAPTYRERKDFGQALRTALIRTRDGWGEYGFGSHNSHYAKPMLMTVELAGLEWEPRLRWNPWDKSDPTIEFHAGRTHKAMQVTMSWSHAISGDLSALSLGMEGRARDVHRLIEAHEEQLIETRQEIADLQQLAEDPWPKNRELQEKQARLAELIGELEQEALGAEAQPESGHARAPTSIADAAARQMM